MHFENIPIHAFCSCLDVSGQAWIGNPSHTMSCLKCRHKRNHAKPQSSRLSIQSHLRLKASCISFCLGNIPTVSYAVSALMASRMQDSPGTSPMTLVFFMRYSQSMDMHGCASMSLVRVLMLLHCASQVSKMLHCHSISLSSHPPLGPLFLSDIGPNHFHRAV
jgi:hypothetical protein